MWTMLSGCWFAAPSRRRGLGLGWAVRRWERAVRGGGRAASCGRKSKAVLSFSFTFLLNFFSYFPIFAYLTFLCYLYFSHLSHYSYFGIWILCLSHHASLDGLVVHHWSVVNCHLCAASHTCFRRTRLMILRLFIQLGDCLLIIHTVFGEMFSDTM